MDLTLHPDTISSMYDKLLAELSMLSTLQAGQEESICSLCDITGYGYMGIPPEWLYIAELVNDKPVLLCTSCLGNWAEKFDLPELTRELGDLI